MDPTNELLLVGTSNSQPARGFQMFYAAALLSCLGHVSLGAAMGYTSPAFLSMDNHNGSSSTFVWPKPDSEESRGEYKSWIGSVVALGALVGGLMAGPFIDRFGRRTILIVQAIPFTAGWLTIAFSGTFIPMMIGRVIVGFCCGVNSLAVPVYVAETVPANVRGFLGSAIQLCFFIGVLVAYVLGFALEWNYLALSLLIFPILCAVSMFFMPESPRWQLKQGRREEALKGIKFLNGKSVDAEAELQEMEVAIQQQPQGKISWNEMKSWSVIHPFLLSLALMFFQQWSGTNGVLFYGGLIFQKSGFDTIEPAVAVIILAIAQCCGTLLAAFVIDRIGRKILLQISGSMMATALTALAIFNVFVHIKGDHLSTEYGWVTVVSLSIYVFVFAMGYGPIAWLMMGELLPLRVRGPLSAVSTAFNWTNAFLVTKTFQTMIDSLEHHGAYFFYDGVCILSCVFVFFFLPETKGKTLEDIEKYFSRKSKRRILSNDTKSGERREFIINA